MSDDFVATAHRLLKDRQCEAFEFSRTRRHRRIVLTHGGTSVSVVFPTSGSDNRGVHNFKADIHRALDALGVPKPVRMAPPRPRSARRRIARAILPSTERAGPRADWRDGLRGIAAQLFGGEIGSEA